MLAGHSIDVRDRTVCPLGFSFRRNLGTLYAVYEELTLTPWTWVEIVFSVMVPLDEAQPSSYVPQREQG
jgi:hypothetical protein